MNRSIVVAITGASGATYSVRLLEVLLAAGCDVHLTISIAGQTVLKQELDLAVDLERFDPAMLRLDGGDTPRDPKLRSLQSGGGKPGKLHFHHPLDYLAPIAGGAFHTDGMVVCPCSCGSLGAIVHGISANLIHRAAEVHLKEGRKLILVPRETPLSLTQIENMRRGVEAGAVILPAMPGFYHGVQQISDLVDFVVSRVCDQLGIANLLVRRWGEKEGAEDWGLAAGD